MLRVTVTYHDGRPDEVVQPVGDFGLRGLNTLWVEVNDDVYEFDLTPGVVENVIFDRVEGN